MTRYRIVQEHHEGRDENGEPLHFWYAIYDGVRLVFRTVREGEAEEIRARLGRAVAA